MNLHGYKLKIIVLAAGKSERFGGVKLLAKIKPESSEITLIEQVLQQVSVALHKLNIDKSHLQVATGIYHAQLADVIGNQYSLSYCENAHLGMGHTIAQSVAAAIANKDDTSHIMITLADQVALNADDYIRLIKQSLTSPSKLVCAKAGQEMMPPAIFPKQYFNDLMSLSGDKGAKILLHQNKENLQTILIANAVIDIDTKPELANWINNNQLN